MLISADYSQIELRLLAHIGDIPQLKRAFRDGLDIHAMTASEMFGVPVEGMPAEIRRRAKAINFGIIYGISAFGLANQLASRRTRPAPTSDLLRALPRHPRLHGRLPRAGARAGLRHHPVRAQDQHPDDQLQVDPRPPVRRARRDQRPIQGAAADVMRRAMIRMPAALEAAGLTARMLLQVHDELVFEAPEDEAEAVCEVAQHGHGARRRSRPSHFSVPLVVEARAAANWEEAH